MIYDVVLLILTQTCSSYYDCLVKTSIQTNYKSIFHVLCQFQVKVKSAFVIRHLGRLEIKNNITHLVMHAIFELDL